MVSILRSHSGAWSGYNIVGRPPLAAPVVATAAIAISGGCSAGGRESSSTRQQSRRTPFPPSPPPDATRLPARLSAARWVDFPALPLSPTTPLPPPVWGVGFLVAHPSRPAGTWRAAATAAALSFLERCAALSRRPFRSLSLLTVFPGNSVVTRSSSSVSLSLSGRKERASPLQRAIRPNQPSCRRCG